MNYRIVTRDAFRVAGVGAPIHPEMEKNFAAVPALWHSAVESGTLARLLATANRTGCWGSATAGTPRPGVT